MTKELIKKLENIVKKSVGKNDIAHRFDHVDRVRRWAIKLGEKEKLDKRGLLLLEIAALGHDFDKVSKGDHGLNSAKKIVKVLEQLSFGTAEERKIIFDAIKCHNKLNNINDNKIGVLLKDADRLDGFGAFGLIRAAQSWSDCLYYDQNSLARPKVVNPANRKYLIDEIYFQMNWYDMLRNKSAKIFARPYYKLMLDFIKNLKRQIKESE